jgi:phasin family protein
MMTTPEKLSIVHKAAIDFALATVRTAYDSSERLVALNLNTARALIADGTANVKALAEAKSPDELIKLQTAMARPAVEKALGYYRNCYEIVAQSCEEAIKPLEIQFAELSKLFCAELEKAAKAAPVGSEAALAAVKSGIAAANSTYDQVTKATRQVVEIAEANIAAAADAAVKAVGSDVAAGGRRKSA